MIRVANGTPATQGKCEKCQMAFTWKAGRGKRLADVRCPNCKGPLARTSDAYKRGPWYSLDGYVPHGGRRLPVFNASHRKEAK